MPKNARERGVHAKNPYAISNRPNSCMLAPAATLNHVIVRQQQQIDALIRELGRLHQPSQEGVNAADRELRDDLLPHY